MDVPGSWWVNADIFGLSRTSQYCNRTFIIASITVWNFDYGFVLFDAWKAFIILLLIYLLSKSLSLPVYRNTQFLFPYALNFHSCLKSYNRKKSAKRAGRLIKYKPSSTSSYSLALKIWNKTHSWTLAWSCRDCSVHFVTILTQSREIGLTNTDFISLSLVLSNYVKICVPNWNIGYEDTWNPGI